MNISSALSFANISWPVRIALCMIGGGGGAAITHAFFGAFGMRYFLCGIMGVGVLMLLYVCILRLIRRRKSASFDKSLKDQSSQSSAAFSKAEQVAKLDDLRSKFQEGVEVFRRAGKDFYSIPWYLLIGTPASGKSEAIRRSGVGFPAGVQDYLQGVGGTINMHWWFTNHAVVLDLAGRVVFGDAASGSNSEWETFLRLLKKQRPNCPINGMIVAISAKSMIEDSCEDMVKNAQKIAEQINRVQRMLDVRFPVYIMVTMCDLVTGFREFFETLRGVEEQQQILGWSNNQPIDDSFKTEMTDQYLATVVERLFRRRQIMMSDPTPQRDLSDSRLDEVDAMFSLPDRFAQLSTTLKLYLQTVFVPNDWSAKPPFLRGIYFTSSMQEGSALDVELAKALGLPLNQLPADGIWKRERSFFLRDLFLEKIFQEKGLVTRATNVLRQYRCRKVVLLAAAALSTFLLILLTVLGWRTLENRIGRERDLWRTVAEEFNRDGDNAMALIKADQDTPGVFVYQGNQVVAMPDGGRTSYAELYAEIFSLAKNQIKVPRIFRLSFKSESDFTPHRSGATRVLFENGILKPLIECSRAKMSSYQGDWSPDATAALATLVKIHVVHYRLTEKPEDAILKGADLDALFRFVLSKEDLAIYKERRSLFLGDTLQWCYNSEVDGKAWPPVWFPRSPSLASDVALSKGVNCFIAHCVDSAGNIEPQVDELKKLLADMESAYSLNQERCYTAEKSLISILSDNQDDLNSIRGFDENAMTPVLWERKRKALSSEVASADKVLNDLHTRRMSIDLCKGDNIVSNYMACLESAAAQTQQSFAKLKIPPASTVTTNTLLLVDIRSMMDKAVERIKSVPDADKISAMDNFHKLDFQFSTSIKAFAKRLSGYRLPIVLEELDELPETWEQQRKSLSDISVAPVHRALEQFCNEMVDLCDNCLHASNDVAVVKVIKRLSSTAKHGLSSIDSRSFVHDPEMSLKSWRDLPIEARNARRELRDYEADRFYRDFFVDAVISEDDYVIQYWHDLSLVALKSLVDGVEPEIERLWAELSGLARFPLSLQQTGEGNLSLKELAQARNLLDTIGMELGHLSRKGTGKTIGEGARTSKKWLNDQLDRLSNPRNGELKAWVSAAMKVVEALPDNGKIYSYKVSLVSTELHDKLIEESGIKKQNSAYVEYENYRISLDFPGAKYRLGNAALLSTVKLPGEPFTLYLYEYGEAQPQFARKSMGQEPWAILELILLQKVSRRDSDDPHKWYVPIVLKQDGNRQVVLWLQIETNTVIPTQEEWPVRLEKVKGKERKRAGNKVFTRTGMGRRVWKTSRLG